MLFQHVALISRMGCLLRFIYHDADSSNEVLDLDSNGIRQNLIDRALGTYYIHYTLLLMHT